MLKINHFTALLVSVIFLVFTSCEQQPQTTESIYPDNEIPVSTESQEALQALVDGLTQSDLGQGENARTLYDKALELDPDFVSAQMYRTFISNSAKDFGENRNRLLAMRDQANEAEVIMMDILEANMSNDGPKVVELATQLVEKYPNSARARNQLAGSYQGLEQTDKAREHMAKAIELNPDFLPAIFDLGVSYMFDSPKDLDKAEEYMSMAVEKAPESSRARINQGDCYRAQNDLEKALANYVKAAELDPDDQVAHSKAGHANSFLGNFDAARKNFQAARAVSQYGTDSYNFEAFTYLYEGDRDKALAFLLEAAETIDGMDIPESNKTGNKMNCMFNCAMIAMHHSNADQLNEIVAMMKPLSQQFIQDVGSEAVKTDQEANMHYWDAVASATEGNYEDAAAKAELFKTTVEQRNDPYKLRPYHRVHALVTYKQGDYEKALDHMAELNMDEVYDKYWAAKANQMAGNTEKAMEMFKEIADFNFNEVGYALIRSEVKDILAEG